MTRPYLRGVRPRPGATAAPATENVVIELSDEQLARQWSPGMDMRGSI